MILTPDSSAQDTLVISPAPELLIPNVSSHDSRASTVPRVPSQGMSSPYHVMQLADHHLSPNMPTMDSTVSSAKPEPELNIGICISFYNGEIITNNANWCASVKSGWDRDTATVGESRKL